MKEELLIKLKEIEKKFPFMFAAPATDQEIQKTEQRLGRTFSQHYKDFLGVYGGAMVGAYPIFGIHPVEPMDEALNTVELATERFANDGWEGLDAGIVISENHAGDPAILKNDGSVHLGSHDGTGQLIWNNFDDFLSWCLER